MSTLGEETIIKISSADRDLFYGHRETPPFSLKIRANKLILTNRRFICIRKGLLDWKDYSKIENVEKGLKRKGSFSIPLDDIIDVKAFRKRLTDCLLLHVRTQDGVKPYLFASSKYDGDTETYWTEDMSPWVKAIEKVKRELASTVAPSAPPEPATAAKKRHCIHCGAEIPEGALYCPSCGEKQEA